VTKRYQAPTKRSRAVTKHLQAVAKRRQAATTYFQIAVNTALIHKVFIPDVVRGISIVKEEKENVAWKN
jgi:hypothetical protein